MTVFILLSLIYKTNNTLGEIPIWYNFSNLEFTANACRNWEKKQRNLNCSDGSKGTLVITYVLFRVICIQHSLYVLFNLFTWLSQGHLEYHSADETFTSYLYRLFSLPASEKLIEGIQLFQSQWLINCL